jgi:hypothetical protein
MRTTTGTTSGPRSRAQPGSATTTPTKPAARCAWTSSRIESSRSERRAGILDCADRVARDHPDRTGSARGNRRRAVLCKLSARVHQYRVGQCSAGSTMAQDIVGALPSRHVESHAQANSRLRRAMGLPGRGARNLAPRQHHRVRNAESCRRRIAGRNGVRRLWPRPVQLQPGGKVSVCDRSAPRGGVSTHSQYSPPRRMGRHLWKRRGSELHHQSDVVWGGIRRRQLRQSNAWRARGDIEIRSQL